VAGRIVFLQKSHGKALGTSSRIFFVRSEVRICRKLADVGKVLLEFIFGLALHVILPGDRAKKLSEDYGEPGLIRNGTNVLEDLRYG